jgi:hypothetical protein
LDGLVDCDSFFINVSLYAVVFPGAVPSMGIC